MPGVSLSFWKYQGLGNDFVVVEAGELMSAERARQLCDRRRGIGGDGVLSVLPPRAGGIAYMHIYNSDGSVAAMCGNGVRCDRTGHVESVSVEMGPARWQGEEEFRVGREILRAQRISMGNPHAVFF